MSRRQTLADQLRSAIKSSGLSVYRIALDTGVSQPVISRFVNGNRTITVETANALAAYFDMRLTAPRLPNGPARPLSGGRKEKG